MGSTGEPGSGSELRVSEVTCYWGESTLITFVFLPILAKLLSKFQVLTDDLWLHLGHVQWVEQDGMMGPMQ